MHPAAATPPGAMGKSNMERLQYAKCRHKCNKDGNKKGDNIDRPTPHVKC